MDAPYSWEIGTLAEALTELEWKRLGVFAHHSIPPPAQLAPGEAADVMSIAERSALPQNVLIFETIC